MDQEAARTAPVARADGRIVLVSAPWPLYNRPSIQLGALKAYLQKQFPRLTVRTLHFYLQTAKALGYEIYQAISERTWVAECMFAALLFPERKDRIEGVFRRETRGKPQFRGVDFAEITRQLGRLSDELIGGVRWNDCFLAGFSICLCQLTSSLYFIRRIKKQFPRLPVVIGGSAVSGETLQGIMSAFPEVDYGVNGEGELPLAQLIRHLCNEGSLGAEPHIPGVTVRGGRPDSAPPCLQQLPDLSAAPTPDFDDYFRLLKSFEPAKTFFPTLCAETSRGCWWGAGAPAGRKGCTFCNLNLQWHGYRTKKVSQIASEVDELTAKYKTLTVAFTDNLLPVKQSREIFSQIAGLNKDLHLFGEVRANLSRKVLAQMRQAGMEELQIGIESLSSRLLRKLNKGTTAIQNLQVMKDCEGLGISNISNLILYFPGSDEEDVKETLHALDFALPFMPLRLVHFWLGLHSPAWERARSLGLRAVFNHPNYAALLSRRVAGSIQFMIQAYRGDRGRQRRLWRPVREKVRAWTESYTRLHRGPSCSPILSFRDGRDFLIIRQKRGEGEPMTHRLVGTSRAIYLFCARHRSVKTIVSHFPAVGEERILAFLRMMVDKRLMFGEDGRYLSLAVPARRDRMGG